MARLWTRSRALSLKRSSSAVVAFQDTLDRIQIGRNPDRETSRRGQVPRSARCAAPRRRRRHGRYPRRGRGERATRQAEREPTHHSPRPEPLSLFQQHAPFEERFLKTQRASRDSLSLSLFSRSQRRVRRAASGRAAARRVRRRPRASVRATTPSETRRETTPPRSPSVSPPRSASNSCPTSAAMSPTTSSDFF